MKPKGYRQVAISMTTDAPAISKKANVLPDISTRYMDANADATTVSPAHHNIY